MSVLTNEERVDILSNIVNINSVNDNEIEVAQYLKGLFEAHGIETEIDEITQTRVNLIAKIGSGSPVVGISGHMDVVSEGDCDAWKYPPFELTETDGKLYGRGASDMKSGLAALAIALIEIKEQDLLKQGTIKFMATSGEEMEQLGSKQLYEKGYMDDVDALIIAEPSETNIVYAHKGSMDYRITSYGEAAHSSMPIIGRNAIQPLMHFVLNIDEAYQEALRTLNTSQLDFTQMVNHLGHLFGDKVDLNEAQKVLSGLVISNTIFNGGNQVNSVPDRATAEFNIRTVPEYNNDDVKALFNHHLKAANNNGADLKEDLYLDLDPVITTGQNTLIETGYQIAKDMFDKDILITPMPGVTDASNLLKGKDENFPFLMYGPGSTAHQINEYVDKKTYLDFIEYFISLLTQYTNKAAEK
ncbi:ArgE/DapE family deacylase [Staphylococcus sp. IVB6181]|uniref:ArgE/DapE family deacylase n=1 Tax=Staphylococcus sp. IVB6181 TaxID=2929481 RepID=UPI0021CEE276|nr:ArgE/DapE family deacylase [Staphylococcus sp. IVB6181]UXV36109.1 ArgE/DapE family deacylase [Staphylococcus sp. IVB6181]